MSRETDKRRLSASMQMRTVVDIHVGVWEANTNLIEMHQQVEREGLQKLAGAIRRMGKIVGPNEVYAITYNPFVDFENRDRTDPALEAALARAVESYQKASGGFAPDLAGIRAAVVAALSPPEEKR